MCVRVRHSNKVKAWHTQGNGDMDSGEKHLQGYRGKGVTNTEKGWGRKYYLSYYFKHVLENKLMVARWVGGLGDCLEKVKGIKKYKLPVIKIVM